VSQVRNDASVIDAPELAMEAHKMSLPLVIVGNKVDKLSWNERSTLVAACPQQIFVVSISRNTQPQHAMH
jgi:hypothetical protein